MVKKVARDVFSMLQDSVQARNGVSLKSIKVCLPEGYDADEVSICIEANYPQCKAHKKGEGIIAIGWR